MVLTQIIKEEYEAVAEDGVLANDPYNYIMTNLLPYMRCTSSGEYKFSVSRGWFKFPKLSGNFYGYYNIPSFVGGKFQISGTGTIEEGHTKIIAKLTYIEDADYDDVKFFKDAFFDAGLRIK